MDLDIQLILLLVGGAFLAYVVGKLVVKGDTAVEDRRREAIELSQQCVSNGLPLTAELLEAYAVGDYSGLVSAVRHVARTLRDEDSKNAVLKTFLDLQLTKRLGNPAQRDELLRAIEDRLSIKIPREVVNAAPAELEVKRDAASPSG